MAKKRVGKQPNIFTRSTRWKEGPMWIHKHEPRGHEKPLFALLCHYARLASITQSRFPIYARPSRILVVQITTRICLLSTFDLYLDRYQYQTVTTSRAIVIVSFQVHLSHKRMQTFRNHFGPDFVRSQQLCRSRFSWQEARLQRSEMVGALRR